MLTKKIDFLFLYEHKEREMNSLIVIKQLLEHRGYTVLICQVGLDDLYAQGFIRPKVLVLPWLYDDTDFENFGGYKGAYEEGKFKVVNLHHEQLTYPDALEFSIPKGKASQVYHMAWGEYYQQNLLNAGVKDNLIKVTGCPRLDFSTDKYGKIRKSDIAKKYNLNSQKKWILIVGNFTWMNTSDAEAKKLEERGIKDCDELLELIPKSYFEILRWLEDLERDISIADAVELIYRPHPNESTTIQLEMLQEQYDNFHIINTEGIGCWYQCCDLAFTWCSTSSVEAACAKIPILALNPFEIPDRKKMILVDELEKISDVDGFKDKCSHFIGGETIETKREFIDKISFYYRDALEGRSCENTVDALIEIYEEDTCFTNMNPHRNEIALKKIIKYGIKKILFFLGIYQKTKKGRRLSGDRLTNEEYKEYSKKFMVQKEN